MAARKRKASAKGKKAGKRSAKQGKKKHSKKRATKRQPASKKKRSKKKAKTKATGKKKAKKKAKQRVAKKTSVKRGRVAKQAVVKKPRSKSAASKKKPGRKQAAAKKQAATKKPVAKKPVAKKRASVQAAKKRAAETKPREPVADQSTTGRSAAETPPQALEAEAQITLSEGQAAPAFDDVDQSGARVSSDSLRGQPYVLYFYPKDNTPGCTTEACDFRDQHAEFERLGVKVIGISPDSERSHIGFADKFNLNFSLLADTEKELAKKFGAWVLKKNYGREYMGVQRSTFLVGADGLIKKVWRGVKVPGHVQAVLEEAIRAGEAEA